MPKPQSRLSPHDDLANKDALRRQYDILRKETPQRLAFTALAFLLAVIYLPWPIVAVCAFVNFGGEFLCLWLLHRVLVTGARSTRLFFILVDFSIELAYVIPPALIWHIDSPYSKAFAVGMTAATMMHLTTVRALHLPSGLVGIAALALAALTSNTVYWLARDDLTSLVIATICALAILGYCVGAMVFNNRTHREIAAGRAEAQAANAAKGRFLAQMSHELRTPMNAILGMGHAELRRATNTLSRDRLSVLIDAAEGLNTILDDILDTSAVQEGRLPIRPQPCDPRAEIAATMALFRPMIEEAGLVFHLDIAADLPKLALLDPQRLRQCLSNLLSNAVKNTRSGWIGVRASLKIDHSLTIGRETRLLRIEVFDSGPGIAPELRSVIFEPFMRGAAPFSAVGGYGLGLSISRTLAQQMGGDLVLAQPGTVAPPLMDAMPWTSGACFVLTLALPSAPAGVSRPAALSRAEAEARIGGRRVLVVDDIATNRLVAVAFLQAMGAATVETSGGAEALTVLRHTRVDLILLDMNMPGMDGLQTLAAIRALAPSTARVPVIALTADAREEQRLAYLAQGLDGYLSKPLSPERLAAELGRLLAPKDLAEVSA